MKRSSFRALLLTVVSCAVVGCAGFTGPSHQKALDYTPLDAAIEGGDLPKVKELVTEDPRLVNGRGWGDTAPLHLAALNDFPDIAAFLLDKGANVDAKAKGGATALHIAAQRNNRTLVKLLLAHKANINAEDSKQRTPSDRAIEWHHPEMAEFLKSRGGHSTKARSHQDSSSKMGSRLNSELRNSECFDSLASHTYSLLPSQLCVDHSLSQIVHS